MQKKKAFTLVEMLVTMAIIAVILGLALFGIAAAQRNSRNTQRRAAAQDINIGMQDFYTRKSTYPGVVTFDTVGNVFMCVSGTCNSTTAVVTVPLKSPATGCAALTVTGATQAQMAGCTANTTSTTYCFGNAADGFQLGMCLETPGATKDVYQAGTSTTGCTLTCPN